MNRRLVAVAIALFVAFALVGCGGEEEPAPEQAAVTTPPPAPAGAPVIEVVDRSPQPTETTMFQPFPTGTFVPEEITQRLNATPKQPMIILFVNNRALETKDVRGAVTQVRDDNTGAIDLIEYDLGKYGSVNSSGAVVVDPAINADEKGAKVVALARELGNLMELSSTAYVPAGFVVDDQGYIIFTWRGYIDPENLGRQVARTKD